jgi:hemoglobin/transferrin/lactoferrin receptor protein
MTGHFDFSLGGKKLGSLSSFTYSKFGDLKMGQVHNPLYGTWGFRPWYAERINGTDTMIANPSWNKQVQSGYSQYDILQKFLFRQSLKVSHVLNFQYSSSSDIFRYDRLTQMSGNLPRFAQWYYGPQERLLGAYTLNLRNDEGFYDNARVIVAYQQIEESRHDRRFGKDILNHRTENLNIVTLNADFAKKKGKHEMRYGLDGWYNHVKSTAYSEDIVADTTGALDTRYPDGGSTMSSAAAYFSHAWEISEKFIINDGIRLSTVMLASTFIDTTFFPFPFNSVSQNNTALNGNIGMVFMPGGGWRFTLLGSTGFRAPNVDDMTKVFSSTSGNLYVPNPDLKAEYSYNADFGMSKSFLDKVNLGGTVFYTFLNSAITTANSQFNGQDSVFYDGAMSQVQTSVNAGSVYVYGASLFLKADFTNYFSMTSTFNYTYGRINTDSTDYPLDHIAPVFGKTSMNLRAKKFRGEFFVLYSGAKKSKDYNLLGEDNHLYSADPVKGYMPAWTTLNVRGSYQFHKTISVQVSVENVMDTITGFLRLTFRLRDGI